MAFARDLGEASLRVMSLFIRAFETLSAMFILSAVVYGRLGGYRRHYTGGSDFSQGNSLCGSSILGFHCPANYLRRLHLLQKHLYFRLRVCGTFYILRCAGQWRCNGYLCGFGKKYFDESGVCVLYHKHVL